jgi:CubicO group peptidase (beta-lactamase class C family)
MLGGVNLVKGKKLVIGALVVGALALVVMLAALAASLSVRVGARVTPATTRTPAASRAASSLRFESLMNGSNFDGPVDEAALTPPEDAAPPAHVFEGRLELLGEKDGGRIQVLRGELEPEYAYLPEFDFEFVQSDGYLIPTRRGLIITDHPQWNIHLEPGRVWQEAGDGEFSRASLPFALTVKGTNATFNGTLTFLFADQRVSKVWYQVTQETTTYTQANLWGLLEATYHPSSVAGAEQIRADFAAELAARLPVKPIQALADDYPGVDVSAFGRGVTPEHMTWYGVVVNGVNYLGGCQTRFGIYPYCESMRASSYSTAKSAFVSVALMRLVQRYGPEVASLLIRTYVPEYAASPGDWEQVTFNHVIDMSSGNYVSPGFMVDDNSDKMGEFFAAQPYARRIQAAFDCPHAAEPGTRWVYRTSDTFILTRALHNYLKTLEGPQADIFQFVVDEVYRPLGLGPGAYTTMRTADDNWQGQAEGGYGLWWIPDDVARIATLLNNDGGTINGVQVLQPDMLAAALQHDPDDRGVRIDGQRMYNNAFWANRYTQADGFDCEFWVAQMLGVSGNVVALMPNGVTYYYFSDNQEFTWDAALREADKIIPFCRSSAPVATALPQPTRTPPSSSATPIPAVATPTTAPAGRDAPVLSETPTGVSSSLTAPSTIAVPQGNPPAIDGTMSPGEWDSAAVEPFSDGSKLLMLYSEGYLYLGIRANTPEMIVGNLFVDHGDEIAILHSSAALGTALYERRMGSWQQTQGFEWRCRRTDNGQAARAERDAFLQEEHWVAANARMGSANEAEYKVEMTNETLRIAVNFLRASKPDVKIAWPNALDDDCIKPTPGGLPVQMHFSPDRWATISTP